MSPRRPVIQTLILGMLSIVGSCEREGPTVPRGANGNPDLLTAEDSAAFSAARVQTGATSLSASGTSISLSAGESILVTVISTECSGNPETVKVYGVISGVVASGSCATLTGTTITLGPATASGTISFKATHEVYGEGPAGLVNELVPGYTVGMNDGYGDTDYDDVIISVFIVCPPVGDSIIDHPDFRSRYDSLMKVSRVDDTVRLNRREYGMFVRTDASAPGGIRIDWPNITSNAVCGVTFPDSLDGVVAMIHDHLWREGELDPCGDARTKNKPFNPRVNGGGSDFDWAAPKTSYVFTPEWVFRLTPGTAKQDRPKNPNQWRQSPNGCFLHEPPALL
jgi:hypothetical protein